MGENEGNNQGENPKAKSDDAEDMDGKKSE